LKISKNYISSVLAIIFVAALSVFAVAENSVIPYDYAADEPTVRVLSISGKAGEDVTIVVTIENNPGISSYGLTMLYNENKLVFISAANGDRVTDSFRFFNYPENDQAHLRSMTFTAYDVDGAVTTSGTVLFTITFKIKEGVEPGVIEGSDLRLGYFDFLDGFAVSSTEVKEFNIVQGNISIETDFVPVADITGVPATATAGTPLTLTGTVVPNNAAYKDIVWCVKDAGATGATITGNSLNTSDVGTVMVTATIENGLAIGADYVKEFTVTVNAIVLYGDINCDGRITLSDLSLFAQYFIGGYDIENRYPMIYTSGDMDHNGILDSTDLSLLTSIIVNSRPPTIDNGQLIIGRN